MRARIPIAATALAFGAILLAQTAPVARKLTWDALPVDCSNQLYRVYEKSGTNWMMIGSTVTNEYALSIIPGAHLYTVTSSNYWGESPFSDPAGTPAVISGITNLKIK
jgi:hypothetical protein